MSRRGNCHDNAVAGKLLPAPQTRTHRRHTYLTRDAARLDVFDYIEMFYNRRASYEQRHAFTVDFEVRQQKLNEAGVRK